MDLYHSRLTQDDVDDLIIKYKMPRDLHPRLPLEEFVMSELLDDAIDRANGDLVILDAMVWRHLDAAIDDPRHAAGSFSMDYVYWLSAHVIMLRDMPEVMGIHDFLCLPEWTEAERILPLVRLVPRFLIRLKLLRSERPLLLVPLRAMFPSVLDSRGKGIMADDDVAQSVGVSRTSPSFSHVPLFRDVSGDTIHADFFPFYADLYYATYPQDGVDGNCEFTLEEWDAPYRPTFKFPTPDEMVRVEALFEDQLTAKMSGLHSDSRLKGYEEKVDGAAGLELQVSTLKKKIKSLTKSLDNLHAEVARLSAALNQATVLEAKKDEEILRLKTTPPKVNSFLWLPVLDLSAISKHATKPLSVILQLEPKKLAHPANFPPSRDARVSPPTTKELTVTPASKSLELSANVDLTAFVDAFEHNKEMGIFVSLEDVVELVEVGSKRATSSPNDVMVTLSVGEKGDRLVPFSTAGEEAAANSSGV
ncbi:hypothetical protein Tco_0908564 [Tanacetum coccineum]|uniref:Uncharacterized protein n=1 Tax=Tanacetum coccineum TaxID=301880 RepID=A0ABQ5CTX9_9ASTR